MISAPLTALNFWQSPNSLSAMSEGGWQLSKTTIDHIASHCGPVFSLVGGASYGVLGMLVHPRPWDFIPPNAVPAEVSADCELIPFGAVKEMLAASMHEYLVMMLQIAQNTRQKAYQLEPPPPHAEAARIAPHIFWKLYPGMQHVVAPAAFRLKLWSLQSQILREQCSKYGVEFLPHPRRASAPTGFLADDYFLDGAHANRAYGALVLEQIREIHDASV